MSEQKRAASDRGPRLTRRGLLAVVGVSMTAGCSSVDTLGGDSGQSIRGYDLPDVDPDAPLDPVVVPSVPVDVASAHFADSRARITDLLAELPTRVGPTDVPNGHVRGHLTDAADDATDDLDDARTARTDRVALQALRSGREHARYAAAGWAFVDSGLSKESLQRAHRRAVADARSVRDTHEYTGADPVRAALVHARIEQLLDRATGGDQSRIRDEGELLTVAEWGGIVEQAQAHTDDARHIDARFEASLPDDAGTVEETLARAAESLAADARSRRAELPPEPTAEEWGLTERVVDDLRQDLDHGPYTVPETDGPASAVVHLTDRLARFRALDSVRARTDAGEIASAQSAEAVAETRTAAHDALDAGLAESPNRHLARTVLSGVSWRVAHADRELGRDRTRDALSPSSLDDVMERYVVAAAVARATPVACQRAVDALRSA